ncbi:hypothetical protein JCM10914A_40910 [Paenibacillus sp. JCM 10914]|uniref:pectin acetylesterase-family hydrolase n=1 Tax=Paenibacillus sp. JCM 10914 TaxID=1236974 RepID=UPI0003CC5A38|nr:pectin acetylesterase-family hydrolase [Paenibacillus sp. JCM 10914]GAE05304.1 hypothetical protein JCM10914_1400 [Paenibacillus sp. JCM 10914]
MNQRAKVIKIIGISLGVIIIGVIATVYLLLNRKPIVLEDLAEAKPFTWRKVDLGNDVQSSDGSAYYLLTKKGASDRWVIFFSGGGVSWDGKSAAQPIKVMNFFTGKDLGNYFANIPPYLLTILDGMMNSKREDNPFREWNMVYVPYATGDFHIGNRSAAYDKPDGSSFTMEYNGRTNVERSLEWVYANVKDPEKLLIAGESAGGFGSAFWAGEISEHYPTTDIYQYSDSAFLYSDKWPDILDQEWDADVELNFGFPAEADLIGAAFKGNSDRMPGDTVLLQSYSVYDEVLIHFEDRINDMDSPLDGQKIEEWTRRLRQSVRTLADTVPNYYFFLTDYGMNDKTGMTGHTFATRDTFYDAEEDGITLLRWLDDIINQEERYSVGSMFINELEEGEK